MYVNVHVYVQVQLFELKHKEIDENSACLDLGYNLGTCITTGIELKILYVLVCTGMFK